MKWCHSIKSAVIIGIFMGGGLFGATAVDADPYHYQNILIGSRAAGLGGAYTALSDDTAGCYYNPAGLAMLSTTSVSASMNAYNKSKKTYKSILTGTSGSSQDWEQESSVLLPNFFGVVKKMGKGTLGFSYAVPDSTIRRQDQTFENIRSSISGNPIERYVINIDDMDNIYLFGPSYALRLSNNLSIGATVYAYYRDKQIIRNQALFFEDGEHLWINSYETQEDWGYRPMVGLIWEPVEQLALGISVSQIRIFTSDRRTQTLYRNSTDDTNFADTDTLWLQTESYDDVEDYPVATRLGLSYFIDPRLLFSVDVAYHTETDDKSATFNVALGSEYYIKDNLALRFGLHTDRANTEALSSSDTYQPEHVDIYNASASLSLFNGPSNITLGATYGFGSGEAQMIDGVTDIQDVEIRNISVFLAAAYSF